MNIGLARPAKKALVVAQRVATSQKCPACNPTHLLIGFLHTAIIYSRTSIFPSDINVEEAFKNLTGSSIEAFSLPERRKASTGAIVDDIMEKAKIHAESNEGNAILASDILFVIFRHAHFTQNEQLLACFKISRKDAIRISEKFKISSPKGSRVANSEKRKEKRERRFGHKFI